MKETDRSPVGKDTWKYEIGTGKTPVIVSAIMLALFGGLTLWLCRTQNGAFLFALLLSAVMALVLLATLYRLCFYRVKIGRDAFFYRSGPKNGTCYPYRQLQKAWTSAGREQNGYRSQYCHVDTGAQVIRFPVSAGDKKAVAYLLARVEKLAGQAEAQPAQTYRILGRDRGKVPLAAGCVVLGLVVFLDYALVQMTGWTGPRQLLLWLGSILTAAALGILAVRYGCFRVEIGQRDFFLQTLPWNGRTYPYSQIVSCREIEKVVRHRLHRGDAGSRAYYYYFAFTDRQGVTRRFQFEKPLHGQEVAVLRQRIQNRQEKITLMHDVREDL